MDKLNRIVAVFVIVILTSGSVMPLIGTEGVNAGVIGAIYSDGPTDGLIKSNAGDQLGAVDGTGTLKNITDSDLLFVGTNIGGGFTRNVWRSYLSFETSEVLITDNIVSAQLYVNVHARNNTLDFDVQVFRSDFGTLDNDDWNNTGNFEGNIYNSTILLGNNVWHSMSLNTSAINRTGKTQYSLNSSGESIPAIGFGSVAEIWSGDKADLEPYLIIQTVTDSQAIITYNFTVAGMTNQTTNLYPVEIIDWGSKDLYRYEFWSSNQTTSQFILPDNNFTFLSISPFATVTQLNNHSWNFTTLMPNAFYWVWFTYNKTTICNAHITMFRESTGKGLPFTDWQLFINNGTWTDPANLTLLGTSFYCRPSTYFVLSF